MISFIPFHTETVIYTEMRWSLCNNTRPLLKDTYQRHQSLHMYFQNLLPIAKAVSFEFNRYLLTFNQEIYICSDFVRVLS